MINQREKQQMMDYLVAKLEGTGEVKPRRKELLHGSGIETAYILTGDNNGVVLLVDQVYPKGSLSRLYYALRNKIPNIAPVFFKDGETFFRSAAAGKDKTGIKQKRSKTDDEHSLKNYIDKMNIMISLRPEELFVSRTLTRPIQYYQPASAGLDEGVVSYRFEPVELDYSHLPSGARFGPITRDSERLSIWVNKAFNPDNLKLENGFVKNSELKT